LNIRPFALQQKANKHCGGIDCEHRNDLNWRENCDASLSLLAGGLIAPRIISFEQE
jgi:hypothetical protein